MDTSTIDFYNQNAASYAVDTLAADMHASRQRFLAHLPDGASVLDAGCGSGRDALAFKEAGFAVAAFDASEEMCRIASAQTGLEVRCLRFEDLCGEGEFDGIWACASLLHVPVSGLSDVLGRLYRLLRAKGVLYASFKRGSEERIAGGRYFHDMDEAALTTALEAVGFAVKELYVTADVRAGHEDERWVNAIAGK